MSLELYNEDCLIGMQRIPDKSVDMVLCDLPYGVLNKSNPSAKWDSVLPFNMLWEQYKRIVKNNGAIILTAQGMFTADLMLSNRAMWRYNLVWKKSNRISGFLNANRQPLRNHEDILVFYKYQPTYNPQMTLGEKSHKKGGGSHKNTQRCYGNLIDTPTVDTNEKFPISVLDFDREHPPVHPTQKSVGLFEYLVKTYTNEGDTVLDNTMGSGTTGVACVNTDRNFIGFELDKTYFEIAKNRIDEAVLIKLDIL